MDSCVWKYVCVQMSACVCVAHYCAAARVRRQPDGLPPKRARPASPLPSPVSVCSVGGLRHVLISQQAWHVLCVFFSHVMSWSM